MNLSLRLRFFLPALLASFLFVAGCGRKPAPASQSTAASSSQQQTETAPPPPQPPPPPPANEKPVHKTSNAAQPGANSGRARPGTGKNGAPPPDNRTAASASPRDQNVYPPTQPQATRPQEQGHATADPSRVWPSLDRPAAAEAPAARADENYAIVRVFYATDRQPTGNIAPGQFYGGERQVDDSLHLGTLDVSIPRDHRLGSIERPSIWRLEFREDPDKHVVLLSIVPKSEQQFYAELARKVGSSANKDAFVFVHGFDNTFEQAAWRTAQLSYDLGFQGAPIMYSWPSKGELTGYSADEATIDWATPHLEKFLETVGEQSHATTVHLIAHSMGNRALTRALNVIARKHAGVPPMFKHVFLAAPDIDVGVFRQMAATFPLAAKDVTLYASSRDEAIMASERLHQFDRVGDSTHICVLPHIDTIDASAVDTGLVGHAYYADKRSILSDIFEVIQTDSPPSRRFGMRMATLQQMNYWVLNP